MATIPTPADFTGNVLAAKMSAVVKVTTAEGHDVRSLISFNIKIPQLRKKLDKDKTAEVFCYDDITALYGNTENLCVVMKNLYNLGRATANPSNAKHGHKPDYNPLTPGIHIQNERHTEQYLAAYLAHPDAAAMILARLRTEIRYQHPGSKAAKIYSMQLHMHSNKTCCACCEYSLVGLMNNTPYCLFYEGHPDASLSITFTHNIALACATPSEALPLTLPEHTPFNLQVMVTADERDAHHSGTLKSTPTEPTLYAIQIKNPVPSTTIYQTLFNHSLDIDKARKIDLVPKTLLDNTVFISGSASKKLNQTISKDHAKQKAKEGDDLLKDIARLLCFDDEEEEKEEAAPPAPGLRDSGI